MLKLNLSIKSLEKLLQTSPKHILTHVNYPSRGQSSVQEIYQTLKGKFFLKKVSKQNHIDCRIDPQLGSIAEREFWAYTLADFLGLRVPQLWLLDKMTTLQVWLDYPDVKQYSSSQGRLYLKKENVFDCGLFDWIIGQVDRHDANYLYDYVSQEIILIDSAHSLLKYSGSLPDYLRFFEVAYPQELSLSCSSSILKKITKHSKNKFLDLVPFRDPLEKEALLSRVEMLKNISSIQNLIDLYRRSR